MKIELNIDAKNFGDTVGDVFKSLTDEQKNNLIKDAFIKWLQEPYVVEYNSKKADILNYLRGNTSKLTNKNSWQDFNTKDATDKQIEESREFQDRMKDFRSTKEVMIEETTKHIVAYYKEYIAQFIREDKKTQEILKETIQKVTEQFPTMIHDAIVAYFATKMNDMGNMIQTALMQSANADMIAKQIAQNNARY